MEEQPLRRHLPRYPVRLHKAGASTAGMLVMQQMFKDCLGDDFVKYDWIRVRFLHEEEIVDRSHASPGTDAGADYADISNFLGQEIWAMRTPLQRELQLPVRLRGDVLRISHPSIPVACYQEFATCTIANAINDDIDARYEAFAQAEACFINDVTLPYQYEVGLQLTHVNLYSKINTRAVLLHTSTLTGDLHGSLYR